MILLDTHVLVFDALEPRRLSRNARIALNEGEASGVLACSDISLWETAMLISKGRIKPGSDALQFLEDLVDARRVSILPITPAIAILSQSDGFQHGDPADRIIAATAMAHRATLISADKRLHKAKGIQVRW